MTSRSISSMMIFGMILSFSSWTISYGQEGMSSLTMGAARANLPLDSQSFRIEEIVNYHRHDIPVPNEDQPVAMDLKWLRKKENSSVLQIGIATPKLESIKELKPVNLVLVIDHSGSMKGDRIRKVKDALRELVIRLRKKDRLSIVGFNSRSHCYLEGKKVNDKDLIFEKIGKIRADGSTNLHAGLMLGYKTAMKFYDPEYSNRVVLLTDGRANNGVTDSSRISFDSKKFNQRGIELSTIGLGKDFNYQLLRQLADEGKGQVHFVGDQQDIKKTFVKELESILATSATNVSVRFDFLNKPSKVKVFGYKNRRQEGKSVRIPLQNLTYGATAVIMVQLEGVAENQVTAQIQYKPVHSEKLSQITQKKSLRPKSPLVGANQDLKKNYAIALQASKIQKALTLYEKDDCVKAEKILKNSLKQTRQKFPKECDSDVDRIHKIGKNLLNKITKYNHDYLEARKMQGLRIE